jgi:hypothetical protein
VFGKLASVLSSIAFSPTASTVAHAGRRMLGGLGRGQCRPQEVAVAIWTGSSGKVRLVLGANQ